MKIENIIFDLDGTLVDSSQDIIDCLNKAYNNIPNVPTPVLNKYIIGGSLNDIILKVTPEITQEQKDTIIINFRKHYDNHALSNTILYQGVYEILEECKKQNIKMFVATYKPKLCLNKIMNYNSIIHMFKEVVTFDKFHVHLTKSEMISYIISRWSLSNNSTLMVGDDISDIKGAHENGIKSVALLSGYGTNKELENSNPSYIIPTINELKTIINGE